MKKPLIIVLLAFGMKASAQEVAQPYEQMSKMQLTKIYLEQVQKLATNLPYASFTMSDTTGAIDMPQSKYLANKQKNVLSVYTKYNETISKNLYEVIPYADKAQIIQAIQFLENINGIIK